MTRAEIRTEDVAALKKSGAFDSAWYGNAYPDVAKLGIDPAEHFLWIGAKLGRSPLPPLAVVAEAVHPSSNDPRQFETTHPRPDLMTLAQRGMPRPPVDLATEKEHHFDISDERFWSIVQEVQEYTELSTAAMFNLYSAVRYIVDGAIPGDIVECGVHMGGSVMLMERVLLDDEHDRRLYALDTFAGFVRRSEEFDVDLRTGAAACPLEEMPIDYTGPSTENMESVGFKGLRVVKGDVLETIPTLDVEQIALLRLDTDTYDTTKFELEQLYDRVSPGGVIIVDDYGYTVGCKKAVDDFLLDKNVLLQRINANVRAWVKAAQ